MSRRILIVDDSDIERKILSNIISKEYVVIEASDGEEAITVIRKNPRTIAAIILDLLMPGLDGFSVLSQIIKNPVWSQIPVIIATGTIDEEIQIKAMALGASMVYEKPYNPQLIIHCLHNCIRVRESASIVNNIRRDKLTKLLRREAFLLEAEKMIQEHEPGYYMVDCFDIDNFKIINDQYGTAIGDAVLCHIAQCVEQYSAQVEGLGARFMADKFAMLYPSEYADSDLLAEAIQKTCKPPVIKYGITVRIGRYFVENPSIPITAVIDRATMAAESIKGHYGETVAEYDDSMRQQLVHEQEIVTQMDAALQNGEFEPWFQPQYNHNTGELIGAEALVRWRNKETGKLIPPNDFIPIFERNGFVYEVDKYIWEQVCIVLKRAIDEKRQSLPISVNISRCDVFAPDFFTVITDLVKKYQIPLELLRLEITESAFSQSADYIVKIINRLIDFGFTVEIDDFGSGYSSLNTLKDVPAAILKMDMKFLSGKEGSRRSGTIIEAIVRMATWLNMSVIAEGVETKEQADYLKSIGCYYIQGYFYSRPLPLVEYERLQSVSKTQTELKSLETLATYDNERFWDPMSIETLIFNSYVGGAAIIEYNNGAVTLIRTNDRFAHEFASRTIRGTPISIMSPEETLDPENYAIFLKTISSAIEKDSEVVCELQIANVDSLNNEVSDTILYLRWTARAIARAENRFMLYTVVFNISDMRQAEAREHLVEQERADLATRMQRIMENVKDGISEIWFTKTGELQTLYINDRYYEILGYTKEEAVQVGIDIINIIVPEDREKVFKIVRTDIIQSNKPRIFEYRCHKKDGSLIYMQCNASPARIGDVSEPVIISVVRDITEQKLLEQKEQEAASQLHILNDTANKLLSQPDTEIGILEVLRRLLTYFHGERAYVFEFNIEAETMSNTYELCTDNVEPEKDNLQNLPMSLAKFWIQSFATQNYIEIDSVDAIGSDRIGERETLEAQGISSLIATPIRRDGVLLGFTGIDNPHLNQKQAEHLAALGDYITVLLMRRDLNRKVLKSQ